MKKPRIEAKPKEVEFIKLADGIFPTRSGIDASIFADNIADIRDHIIAGVPLPAHYYRSSVGPDHLLSERGWLHLHVGHNIDDNVLLIVEQTDDTVIFIALTNHDIFTEKPRASSIMRLAGKVESSKLKRLKKDFKP